jgi:hypothetical protein
MIMRFVPYIGGFISAIFPLVLAAAVGPGWTMVLVHFFGRRYDCRASYRVRRHGTRACVGSWNRCVRWWLADYDRGQGAYRVVHSRRRRKPESRVRFCNRAWPALPPLRGVIFDAPSASAAIPPRRSGRRNRGASCRIRISQLGRGRGTHHQTRRLKEPARTIIFRNSGIASSASRAPRSAAFRRATVLPAELQQLLAKIRQATCTVADC